MSKKKQCDVTLGELMGNPTDEEVEEFLVDLLKRNGIEIDGGHLMDRMRISMPIDYGVWADCLEQLLGWEILEFDADAEYLKPFGYSTYQESKIPLYATSLGYQPGDMEDVMAIEITNTIAHESDRAVLFFKTPLVKKINGRWFGYYGKLLWDGAWQDFLLNERMKGIAAVVEQAHAAIDINCPPRDAEDPDTILATSFSSGLAGYVEDNEQPKKAMLFGNNDAWKIMLFE